jgi:hypothetical protein
MVCDLVPTAAAKDLPLLDLYSEAVKPVNVPQVLFRQLSALDPNGMTYIQL